MAEPEMVDRQTQRRLLEALRLTYAYARDRKLTFWLDKIDEALCECQLGMAIKGLEQIRPIMTVALGFDPLGQDIRPQGEEPPETGRGEARTPPSLQDLKERIYAKAKADPSWRFWGLYVHVMKMETLQEAYRQAKANDGAPGIDGVTFEQIEARGVDLFLQEIRDELAARTYLPMRNRRKEIPKDGGKKVRVLGIPSIRDRVVQGALKLILEPIFEADFQPGSYGYRPKRTAHEAVARVAQAVMEGKTHVIDLDLKAYFDNVRHHILLEKVARRVRDGDVLHLLKLILKASGKRGVPQGGVISPLLSNVYLNEVDRMLERAQETTKVDGRTYVEYVRYADDLVILIDPRHPRKDWLPKAVGRRLREELAKLQVQVNEEKSREVDLTADGTFGVLGFTFSRRRNRRGTWWVYYAPRTKKRTALLRKLKEKLRRLRSQPVARAIDTVNPSLRGWVNDFRVGDSSRCFSYIRHWVEKKIRRHLMRARGRRGFGWKRWSTRWLYETLGLFQDYGLRRLQLQGKALPCQEVT